MNKWFIQSGFWNWVALRPSFEFQRGPWDLRCSSGCREVLHRVLRQPTQPAGHLTFLTDPFVAHYNSVNKRHYTVIISPVLNGNELIYTNSHPIWTLLGQGCFILKWIDIYKSSPHLDPTRTGHPPCKVRGSTAPFNFTLYQNAAPPWRKRPTLHQRHHDERDIRVYCINYRIPYFDHWYSGFCFREDCCSASFNIIQLGFNK